MKGNTEKPLTNDWSWKVIPKNH